MRRIPPGAPIVTAEQMRAAEDRAIAAGTSACELMERAGAGVAEAARRLAAGSPVVILCGPGNNGGDGYVAARILKANGVDVRVAASGQSKTDTAAQARCGWIGEVEPIGTAAPAPVVVDALFGTGLSGMLREDLALALRRFDSNFRQSRLRIAVDLPSGLNSDDGDMLISSIQPATVTLALGALKPVHVLAESAPLCGTVRFVGLGLEIDSDCRVMGYPQLDEPGGSASKYTRGMVAVVAGAMPGAAALAAEAVLRAGAGYSLLLSDEPVSGVPHAVVQRRWHPDALSDPRIGAIVIGPGLGRDEAAEAKLDAAVATDKAVVIDGDALHLLDKRTFRSREAVTILTPHAGEFKAAFGVPAGNKIDAARDAAARSGAVVVFKGADTVIADTKGDVTVAPNGPSWLSTAGTGDVLAGIVGAMAAVRRVPFFSSDAREPGEADLAHVSTAVWMHTEAARRLGSAFIADDLVRELSAVRASL